MTFKIETRYVKSSDGIHTLSGVAYIPEGEVKGIFHIVHGMTEYIGRYNHLMTSLAQNGYVCCGYDNLGHGKTATDDSELGFFAEKNGYKFLIDDVALFAYSIKAQFENTQYILMGHSMGSFIARLAAEKYPNLADKLIICGTSGANPASGAGLVLTSLIGSFRGKKAVSPFIYNMAFGSYNKRFEGKTDYDWLTKDESIIAAYCADKYCTFPFTVSAMHDLIMMIKLCNSKSWFNNLPKTLPILLVAGQDDPVGNYGKGVMEVYDRLVKSGHNTTLKLYKNCRHEIHNDTCKEEVTTDIINWLK